MPLFSLIYILQSEVAGQPINIIMFLRIHVLAQASVVQALTRPPKEDFVTFATTPVKLVMQHFKMIVQLAVKQPTFEPSIQPLVHVHVTLATRKSGIQLLDAILVQLLFQVAMFVIRLSCAIPVWEDTLQMRMVLARALVGFWCQNFVLTSLDVSARYNILEILGVFLATKR